MAQVQHSIPADPPRQDPPPPIPPDRPGAPRSVVAARGLLGCQGALIGGSMLALSLAASTGVVLLSGFAPRDHASGSYAPNPFLNPVSLVLDAASLGLLVLFAGLVAVTFMRRRWALLLAGCFELVCLGVFSYLWFSSAVAAANSSPAGSGRAVAVLFETLILLGLLALALLFMPSGARRFFGYRSPSRDPRTQAAQR